MKSDLVASEFCHLGEVCGTASRLSLLPRPVPSRRLPEHSEFGPKPNGVDRHLVLMVKAPAAGRVKTRLARGIGLGRATSFYRSMTNSVLSRLSRPGQWQTYLAISPDNELDSRAWPMRSGGGVVFRLAQGGGDLGCRLQRVMDGMPAGPVVIVGSDIPGILSGHIASAFQKLGRADAVFGPSPDGGYWLFGMRRVPSVVQAFEGVRWSTPHALSDTLANFEGRRVAQVGALADIDEVGDLARLGAVATRRVLPV